MQFVDRDAYERFMDTPIAELESFGLSIRVINALEESLNILTVGDLLTTDSSDVETIPNMGKLSLGILYASLKNYYREEFDGGCRSPL